MGFVRHELGKRLRIKRIPALHVHLDDSAERGTRVLHLLGELESGVDPQEVTPFNESLPTPVKRLPHEGDAPEPSAEVDPAAGPDPGIPLPPASKPRTSRHAKGRGQGVDRAAARRLEASRRRKPHGASPVAKPGAGRRPGTGRG